MLSISPSPSTLSTKNNNDPNNNPNNTIDSVNTRTNTNLSTRENDNTNPLPSPSPSLPSSTTSSSSSSSSVSSTSLPSSYPSPSEPLKQSVNGKDNANPTVLRDDDEDNKSSDDEYEDNEEEKQSDSPISLSSYRSSLLPLLRSLRDPEHEHHTLRELGVVRGKWVQLEWKSPLLYCFVSFHPTVPHCSLSHFIGLSIRLTCESFLPKGTKIFISVRENSHLKREEIIKQINDKERCAAAMENEDICDVLSKMSGKNDKYNHERD